MNEFYFVHPDGSIFEFLVSSCKTRVLLFEPSFYFADHRRYEP